MNIENITYPDVNNGLGCRVTLWVSGCIHHCNGCHNHQTWDFKHGIRFDGEQKQKLFDVLNLSFIKGITLSGGDPLCSYDECFELVKEIKEQFPTKDIWLYTGYTLDEIYKVNKSDILQYIDVLVDGKFDITQLDRGLVFRGSRNQIIWEKDENGGFVKSKLND
jgi:anaerobic ribonucleoside-triphosphate reductase activating protein